jgi:hypothetical protein
MNRLSISAPLVAVLASVGCSGSGSTKAEPTFACRNCGGSQAVATHTVLNVSTSWYGRCWEGSESGPLPTPGGDEGPNYREFDCNAVKHEPEIACPGGRCDVRPIDADKPHHMNERRYDVELLSEGNYKVLVTFARSSGDQPQDAHVVEVWRPTTFTATCAPWSAGTGDDGRRDFTITMFHADTKLWDGPARLELRRGDAACDQVRGPAAGNDGEYTFRCTVPKPEALTPAQSLTLSGQDFRLAQSIECAPNQ